MKVWQNFNKYNQFNLYNLVEVILPYGEPPLKNGKKGWHGEVGWGGMLKGDNFHCLFLKGAFFWSKSDISESMRESTKKFIGFKNIYIPEPGT